MSELSVDTCVEAAQTEDAPTCFRCSHFHPRDGGRRHVCTVLRHASVFRSQITDDTYARLAQRAEECAMFDDLC